MEKMIIKIHCVGFDNIGGYKWIYNRFLVPLENSFSFIEDCDNPDFIFCNVMDYRFDFIKYNCPRIFITEENIHPNFQLFDYWIGYNSKLSFSDRFLYAQICLFNIRVVKENLLIEKGLPLSERDCSVFCDFIYSHDDNGNRMHYFKLLNNYKQVNSYGTFNHNTGNIYAGGWPYKNKINLQKRSKFSLIVETSEDSKGLVTEKIFHALIAGSIPIYYGDDEIRNIVNPKRYINIKDFKDDNELMTYICKIDNDDNLYNSIVKEEPLIDPFFFKKQYANISLFLFNIFNQNPEQALRRPKSEGLALVYDNVFKKENKKSNTIYRQVKQHLKMLRHK